MNSAARFVRSDGFALTAPYMAWMVLMTALPETAWAYAVRSAVTAALLAFSLLRMRPTLPQLMPMALGFAVGAAAFAIWISPELLFGAVQPVANVSSPYDPEVCGWPLTAVKIFGSALVISVAEEMFFRRWLVEFAGFWWMVALFAVEHGERWHVGAVTGVVYGLLARRYGLKAATVAHVVTNLLLGIYTVFGERWFYW